MSLALQIMQMWQLVLHEEHDSQMLCIVVVGKENTLQQIFFFFFFISNVMHENAYVEEINNLAQENIL